MRIRGRAENILVLNPGTSASAAYFQPLAKSIVARAKTRTTTRARPPRRATRSYAD